MKIASAILLTAFLGFVIGLYTVLPWWCFTITSLLVSVAIHQKPWKAFVSGFSGMFLLWVVLAFLKDTANEHILSTKVAGILPLGGSYFLLILVTGLVSGLISGAAAITGSFLRK